eukprot:CAMPEP_0184697338 /NCGR_PEP_ID=MMETSP0313-20130426/4331_1 /TAXON_ID=2792 /ORGANISM="Porphyridium aerugineum, Strain SAG 1380-2" /LENGTH=130 /DNA_ID=CAMNT_0027156117 /DNA_START=669 /DNA_END=1061 /DNA_ORIENTATION=+
MEFQNNNNNNNMNAFAMFDDDDLVRRFDDDVPVGNNKQMMTASPSTANLESGGRIRCESGSLSSRSSRSSLESLRPSQDFGGMESIESAVMMENTEPAMDGPKKPKFFRRVVFSLQQRKMAMKKLFSKKH